RPHVGRQSRGTDPAQYLAVALVPDPPELPLDPAPLRRQQLACPLGIHRRSLRRVGSPAMEIRRVIVVGAGQMGGGIGQVVAASGREVALLDAQRRGEGPAAPPPLPAPLAP